MEIPLRRRSEYCKSEIEENCRAPAHSCLADEDLVIYAQQGDQRAFLELVERNYQRCLRLALGIMRNQHDAEDQVQSAILRALQHLDQFRNRAKFSSWLCQIVINECRMRFRERQRTRSIDDPEYGTFRERAQIRDAAPNPEQSLVERDLWDTVKREIQRLPWVYRETLELRYLDDLPLADLADRLGLTVAAVKSRQFRGELELRRRMVKARCVRAAYDENRFTLEPGHG
jgi:RNA polymerase sigma-70 factor, ECF subfamily